MIQIFTMKAHCQDSVYMLEIYTLKLDPNIYLQQETAAILLFNHKEKNILVFSITY